VLKSEYSDPEVIRELEEDIFACLKFLKAAHSLASAESVPDGLHGFEKEGKSTTSVRQSLRWFFRSAALQFREEEAKPKMIKVQHANNGNSRTLEFPFSI
jgi:hypothetical protein